MTSLTAYLNRIGYRGSLEPTLNTLTAIHRAHLMAIPYENLNIHLGRKLTLDLQEIFDKLVTHKRGGWCYEMNGLLAWALREIGFDVTLLSSTVGRQAGNTLDTDDHLILKVIVEQQPYLVDVGFGNGLFEPIPFTPGSYTQRSLTYTLHHHDDRWFFSNHIYGGPGFDFLLKPYNMEDFSGRCHYLQTSPESGFVRVTVCYRFTAAGYIALRGAVLHTITQDSKQETFIDNLVAYRDTLENQFSLHLPTGEVEQLWEKVWASHLKWIQENA